MTATDYDRHPSAAAETPQLRDRLRALWETAPGLYGWLATVDHKEIGIRYIVTAFAFLIAGGVEALVFRLQLAWSNLHLLTPEQYDQLFTMHGMTMIFLYAGPVLSGFSNYLWPLLLGSRDMALPRLNALSYWTYLCAGIFLYASFLIGFGPNVGWFNYVPLAARAYNNGPNIDMYALGMILLGTSTTVGAVNFIVTFLRMRCAGMSINRVPILVWGTLTANAANIFAIPAVSLAFFLLWMDRNIGTHFFDVAQGGSALLWQHLFWMFGHPWVYAIVLPAMGMVSDGLPVFCRRPLVGYAVVAVATIATMVLGFGVWVHHMFATGLPGVSLSFFSAASIIIAVPSAVGVFAWLATIWLGRPMFATPFLFFASFIVLFVIGGVSGYMTGSVPVDWQLTDTYFVVAHLHYVLIGINVFPVVGAVYFWLPKMTGKMMDERLGRWNFWTMFIGFNLGFFPMHISGLMGMPRRIYTYNEGMGWDWLNLVTTGGAILFGIGVLMFVWNVVKSLRHGESAGDNPWDAPTLEWSTTSPPPPYNFAVLPVVASRHPLWEDRLQPDAPDKSLLGAGLVLDHGREALGTTSVDAEPNVILKMPEDTLVPLLLALSMTLVTAGLALVNGWITGVGGLCVGLSIGAWLWPRRMLGETAQTSGEESGDTPRRIRLAGILPVGALDTRASGWWAMIFTVFTEASLFAYLLFSYYYLAVQPHAAGTFPEGGVPPLLIAAINTAILLASSVAVGWAQLGIEHDSKGRLAAGLGIGALLGAVFLAIQWKEWGDRPFSLSSTPYSSLYYVITGFHMAHVVVGVLILLALTVWSAMGYFNSRRFAHIHIGALYWHFVDAVWIAVFFTFYITPLLGLKT